jgi:hypothetical protein
MTLESYINAWRQQLGIKFWQEDAFNAVIPRLLAGEDSVELADAAAALFFALSDEDGSRARLTWLCCDGLPECPLAQGKVLQDAWTTGKVGSILAGFLKTDVMRWFESASKMTLMTEAERAALAALPNIVTAYRGGAGVTSRKLAAGLSWTLDPDRASFFATKYLFRATGAPVVVRADFPKGAILAYLDARNEREIVVNWRRARGVTAVAPLDSA